MDFDVDNCAYLYRQLFFAIPGEQFTRKSAVSQEGWIIHGGRAVRRGAGAGRESRRSRKLYSR